MAIRVVLFVSSLYFSNICFHIPLLFYLFYLIRPIDCVTIELCWGFDEFFGSGIFSVMKFVYSLFVENSSN